MDNLTIECVENYETPEGVCYSKFVAEPLDRGYGNTLGNSLRRVLLSDLEGAAITAIKIDGVLHEFSTIDGMVEDVLDVIMNLKQISLKLHGESGKVMTLSVTGPAEVTAADIQHDSEIEIVSRSQHIATLQDGATLEMEMRVDKGKGFVPSEKMPKEELHLGWLPIDAIYMPVHKVNYKVENSRVGQFTDFDKLIMEVWTNGSIKPDKAMSTSAAILSEKFRYFTILGGEPMAVPGMLMAEQEEEVQKSKEEEISIEELELSIRAYNCLKRANIFNLADLLKKSERELMDIKNFGKKSAEEVIQRVKDMGYQLRNSGRKKDSDEEDDEE